MPPRFSQHSGGTPAAEQLFQYAAKQGDVNQIQRLLAAVDINNQDVDGGTALHRTTLQGSIEVTELLLANGANPNASDHKQKTPLHWAVAHEQVGIVALLLTHGADPNAKDNYGNSPLFTALGSGSMVELMRLLLEHGANPLQENKAGTSAYAVTQIRNDSEAHNLMTDYLSSMPQ